MKISDLIVALQKVQSEHGDIDVTYDGGSGKISATEVISFPENPYWPAHKVVDLE